MRSFNSNVTIVGVSCRLRVATAARFFIKVIGNLVEEGK